MLAFYILFPFILRALQSFSSQMLAVTVMAMYQVVILFYATSPIFFGLAALT